MDVVATVFIQKNRALVTRRPPGKSLADRWEFPGGKVKPGEDLRDALVREIWEELKVRFPKQEPQYLGVVPADPYKLHFFYQDLSSPYIPQEHPATSWASYRELLQKDLCNADQKAVIQFEKTLRPLLEP